MVDALKFLQSDWLRAEDIDDDAPVVVTIVGVKPGKYKPDDAREHLDVLFEQYKSPLGLNNKNLKSLVELLGRDTADWIGQRVTLVVREVEVGGELKRAIRIDDTPPAKERRPRRDDDGPRRPPPERDERRPARDKRPLKRDDERPRRARRGDE